MLKSSMSVIVSDASEVHVVQELMDAMGYAWSPGGNDFKEVELNGVTGFAIFIPHIKRVLLTTKQSAVGTTMDVTDFKSYVQQLMAENVDYV